MITNSILKYILIKKGGYPRFKAKVIKDSYRNNYIKNKYKDKIYENIKLDLINKEITLLKLKKSKN